MKIDFNKTYSHSSSANCDLDLLASDRVLARSKSFSQIVLKSYHAV